MTQSLCETCRWMREATTPRSRFLLCELSKTDATYPKYPPQPVLRCAGHQPKAKRVGADMDRCQWAKTDLYVHYHDSEWGVPVHHDRLLFEFLILEGAQAGLSWETILKKRDNYRVAFDQFDAAAIATYGQNKRKSLLTNAGIIRNKLKIEAAIQNARMFLAVQTEFGTFDKYIWSFVGNAPKQNAWKSMKQLPAKTPESDAMSKDLKRRGFRFVGSTICYAFMQAVGMVNDHLVGCFRHDELRSAR